MHYLCIPWFSPEKAILNICSRYTGTPALRHFVIRQRTGIHPRLCLQLPSAPRVRRELYSTSLIVRTGRLLVRKCHAQTNTLLIFVVIACIFHEAPLLPFFFYNTFRLSRCRSRFIYYPSPLGMRLGRYSPLRLITR